MVACYRSTSKLGFVRLSVRFLVPALLAASCGPLDEAPGGASEALLTRKPSLVQTCGEIKFEVNGGSLVINGSVALETTTPALRSQLVARAEDGPFRACLLGQWRTVNNTTSFRASSVLDEPIGIEANYGG